VLRIKELSEPNPLLEQLIAFRNQSNDHAAVLIADSRILSDVKDCLSEHPRTKKLSVIHEQHIRQSRTYETIYVIGASRWYPEYVFSAPRARVMYNIFYTWIKDSLNIGRAFAPSVSFQPHARRKTVVMEDNLPSEQFDEATDLLPPSYFDDLAQQFSTSPGPQISLDSVNARLVILEKSRVVLVEAEDKSTVPVIDPDELGTNLAYRSIRTRSLLPGMFILLRTGGGGDFVPLIADRILANRKTSLREKQAHWKTLLKKSLTDEYSHDVANLEIDLRQKGSEIANPANIRNWISPRNICPQGREDFSAIMRHIGLAHKIDDYWLASKEIRVAHRKAGFLIRKRLLSKLADIALADLSGRDELTVELTEEGGGSLTAFRVVDVRPEEYLVPYSKIGHVFYPGD